MEVKTIHQQVVVIYGQRCTLRSAGRCWVVRDPGGKVIARATTRFLAIARAARGALA